MNELSTEKLAAIIEEGDFEALVDCVETDFFDCKGGVYICDSDISKRELAKDVGSFANLKGGYILIGPQTQKTETHPFDIINKISYSNRDLIDIDQYHKILKEWLYPEIDGLRIYWKECKAEKGKGLFIIHIPEQSPTQKPFLVTKAIDERKRSEVLFGYVERRRDQSEFKKIQVIPRQNKMHIA